MLEALALEIVLKARLLRSGIAIPRTHDHASLYASLPDVEKQDVGQRYQSARHPAMGPTLADALAFRANVFAKWRYLHERGLVEASMGEMRRAFRALDDGL